MFSKKNFDLSVLIDIIIEQLILSFQSVLKTKSQKKEKLNFDEK